MISTRIPRIAYIFIAFLLVCSCSKFKKIQKSTDMDLKYQAAVSYYQDKDYYRALQLFEELVTAYRGSQKAELSLYYFAKCHYATGDYISAAYYFENFAKTFANSIYTEECAYLVALCNYLDSPKHSLDQGNTMEALRQFQLFTNKYPESKYISECNAKMDELRRKLETKVYENAKLYYQIEDYKAAITALNNVLKDYPATTYREDCLFLILKSFYLYARKSVEAKQQERYDAAVANYKAYKEAFPQGKYLLEANSLADKITDEIKRLSINNK